MNRPAEPPRWVYRFRHYTRALRLLEEAAERPALSDLEKEGLVQRFEYTLELGWKTLNDYLAAQRLNLPEQTPRRVVRAAWEAGVIADGDAWLRAIDARNKTSHTYHPAVLTEVTEAVREVFLPALRALRQYLNEQTPPDAP